MLSPAIETVIKMMETLPEDTQAQVVEHLRAYLEDLVDEIRWDQAFEKMQPQLAAAARRAKQGIIETVDSYINTLSRSRELVLQLRNSALSRLVWLVGIDGFALLNARPFWETLRGRNLTSPEIIWLSMPWALSALFGVITHFAVDEVAAKDNIYFITKVSACELHRIKLVKGQPDPSEFEDIVNDTREDIAQAKRTVDDQAGWTQRFERATIVTLGAGFIWAVVGPIVL